MTGKNLYTQLPLNINLRDDATFENFYTSQNAVLIEALKTEMQVYLWGGVGLGKTHLLIAACHQAYQQKQSASYLPLRKHSISSSLAMDSGQSLARMAVGGGRDDEEEGFTPEILEGLEFQSLVCLDDVDEVMGIPEWEEALFHFYNRAFIKKTRLILSAKVPTQQLGNILPDLKSRFNAGLIFQIKSLSDEEKSHVIQERARYRGFDLSNHAASYLLTRYSRNMYKLLNLIDFLDSATLAAQRKLTIPLLRTVLQGLK